MLKQLLYKWFGLEDDPCPSCEILRVQLEKCDAERRELLDKLINPVEPKEEPKKEALQPITPRQIPWHVRRQFLEGEDKAKAALLRDKEKEIAESKVNPEQIENLEKELGVQENG